MGYNRGRLKPEGSGSALSPYHLSDSGMFPEPLLCPRPHSPGHLEPRWDVDKKAPLGFGGLSTRQEDLGHGSLRRLCHFGARPQLTC